MAEQQICQCTFCNGCDSDVPVGSKCLCGNCKKKVYCPSMNTCKDNEGKLMELEE
jgi:hypothetical protein